MARKEADVLVLQSIIETVDAALSLRESESSLLVPRPAIFAEVIYAVFKNAGEAGFRSGEMLGWAPMVDDVLDAGQVLNRLFDRAFTE